MSNSTHSGARTLALFFTGLLLIAGASAQTTNVWILNNNGFWAFTNNWNPSNSYPNSAGAVALVTNNTTFDQTIYLTNSITLGELVWGDFDRGSFRGLRSTNATVSTITFDTGDDSMALFEHGTGDRPLRDIGRSDDRTDVGILVSDPQGLFIDNFQSFAFYGNDTLWDTNTARAFDGGGHDVVKGEDGTLTFRRIVTNIATLTVRDGFVEFQPEGQPVFMPGISNLVLGVAPGVVDTGANPRGVLTNLNEGGAYDRIQFPYFSIIGAATTNGGAAMTNGMDVTFNRGVFRSLTRGIPNVSNTAIATLPVYTGTFTLNGDANEAFFNIDHQNIAGNTGLIRQTIFTGPFTGSGGFTKIGVSEMLFTGSNDFTGAVNINRGFDNGRGRFGGIGLRENGTFSGVSQITLNREGQLYIDNSSVNLSNRVNDAAAITTRGRSQIELMANGSAASYERFGSVTTAQGSMAFEFDKVDGSPQQQTLDIANLVRAPGSVLTFQASDLQQGAFGLNGPTGIVINLLDGGASLAQVGAGGGAGAVNRSVVVGVFGGDGVDYGLNVDANTMTPNRGDEFMTVDAGRLRTLDPTTEMVNLGGRVTNALFITQASAPTDANVNINFGTRPLTLNAYSLTNQMNPLADKRVLSDATFNSIRFGLVRGDPIITGSLTNNPDDNGRSLLINDGVTLRSESGMLLLGRDTGSTNGDLSPNGTAYIYGGRVDLDGAANNREAIIHNASGNSFILRTSIDATQGLTKSGVDAVYLDAANSIGGTVNVAQGTLVARDSRALSGATLVRAESDGLLQLEYGVAITNIDFRVGERTGPGAAFLQSAVNHNVFGGDIMVENVDPQGMVLFDTRVRAGVNVQTATLTLLGDIGLTEFGMMSDVNLISPTLFGFQESGGILNLKGTFGDRLVAGEALTFDPTLGGALPYTRITSGMMTNRAANQNYVLRFLVDGNGAGNSGDELVVNISNPWNAAGRFYDYQGTIRYLGDGGFWTSNALAASDFANGFSGFQFGGSGTDAGGSTTFLLTSNGQSFNAERWVVATDNSANNTLTMGLEHTGPSNATVTIGNEFYDVDPSAADDQITISGASSTTGPTRELRLFAHDGYDSATTNATIGRVNVIQSIRGNDFSMLTIAGNGVVALQATTNTAIDQDNDIRNFMLLGGELILDRSTNGGFAGDVRRTTSGRAALFLAGGDLTHLGRNTTTTELLTSNLTVKAGDSRVSAVAGGGGTTELFVGTGANTIVTRQRGGTVGFVEDSTAGGAANIRLAGTGVTTGGRVGSWATYGTNYGGGAYTWAATDSLSNIVEFAEAGYSVNTFGAGNHVHLDGVPPIPVADETAASLRYTNATALDMGGFSLDVTEGGILITPTVAGAASIGNGQLTSSGGELIFHNYAGAGGSLAISAGITGNVDLTFSGTGLTVLSGTNTFNGVTRINGGTVQIDDASRLGSTVSNLELRGGTLFTTTSMNITNRTILLGGEGGTFQVAAGTTNFIANLLSESNFLGSTRLNNGVGDLVKTGAGTLSLGTTVASTNNLTAGYNMIQGLTDVREGTLRVASGNNFALGSSKSFYDGTIVRSGATLTLASNSFSYAIQEWLMFEQGSTFRVEPTIGGYNSMSANGVMDFRGDTTVQIVSGDFYLNNSGAGYIMGSGDIIKDSGGALDIAEYSPEYTGDLIVKQGLLRLYGIDNNPLPNAASITIGLNDTTNRSTAILAAWLDRDGSASEWNIDQNIAVQGYTTDTRLEMYSPNHNDVVNFNGNIDLSNFGSNGWAVSEFRFTIEDQVESRTVGGADDFREEEYMNINGDITGGDKRIRTYVIQNYFSGGGFTQRMEPVPGSQLTNEMNIMAFFTFSGTNTGWTGSLEVGNRAGTGVTTDGPDQDKQHFVRFGNNDGAATLAIGASNAVVLRHDATLQAYGSQVTIGSLFSDGSQGGTDGYYGQQLVSNSFLENGGTAPGSFTINQLSNRVFNAVIRDGTYYSPTSTNLASAALSIIKAGSGVLTFDRSNYYTGTTTVREGLLQIAGSHFGGGLYSIENGGSLGGTGIVGSAVSILNGGILAPGLTNDAIVTAGTFNINGNLTLSNSSMLSFDLDGTDATKGAGVNDLVQGIGNLVLDGVLHIEPLGSFTGAGTNDFWTLMTYSGALTDNGVTLDASSQALLDPGLMWYVYNFEAGAIDEIRLGIMVPEPSTWALLLTGLGLVGCMARRRRRS